MEIKENYLDRFTNPNKKIRKIEPWQDFAANICKEFDIKIEKYKVINKNDEEQIVTRNWPAQIFMLARNKRAWLEGKIGLIREMAQYDPRKYKQLKDSGKLGHYLFSTFRKKK